MWMIANFILYNFTGVVEVGCFFGGIVVHEFDVLSGFAVRVESHEIIHGILFCWETLVKVKQNAFH
jgi:hypothetical protein